jgi:hypothetical protein
LFDAVCDYFFCRDTSGSMPASETETRKAREHNAQSLCAPVQWRGCPPRERPHNRHYVLLTADRNLATAARRHMGFVRVIQ